MKPCHALAKRHPYTWAHDAYVSGTIPQDQAALMVASDREFIAECELTGRDARTEAHRIVRDVWSPALVTRAQGEKRAIMGLSVGLYAAPSPEGRGAYCGPTALSALTGLSVEQVEAATLVYRDTHGTPKRCRPGKDAWVRGMSLGEVAPVLKALGFSCGAPELFARGMTFARWRRTHAVKGARYLVLVTGHFVAMCDGLMVDTSRRSPVAAHGAKDMQRKRIVSVIRMKG